MPSGQQCWWIGHAGALACRYGHGSPANPRDSALTFKPFGVNLNLEFPEEERLDVCLEERVAVISFFWRDPSALVPRAKSAGAVVMHTVASAKDARRAVDCGVDIVKFAVTCHQAPDNRSFDNVYEPRCWMRAYSNVTLTVASQDPGQIRRTAAP